MPNSTHAPPQPTTRGGGTLLRWVVVSIVWVMVAGLTSALAGYETPLHHIRERFEEGAFAEAESLSTSLVAEIESATPVDSIALGEALHQLGASQHWQGEFESAEQHCRRSIEIGQLTAIDSLALAERWVSLANPLIEVGRYDEASEYLDLAVPILASRLPGDDVLIQNAVYKQASIAYYRSDWPGAAAGFERVLDIQERRYGPNHADLSKTLIALAVVYTAMDQMELALGSLQRSLSIVEQQMGFENRIAAHLFHQLASAYQRLGDYESQFEVEKRAMEIWERVLPPGHADIGLGILGYAVALHQIGELEEALIQCERSMEVLEPLGPEHRFNASAYQEMADLLGDLGRGDEARPMWERAVVAREALGSEHADLGRTLLGFSEALGAMGEFEEARNCLERARAIYEINADENHRKVGTMLRRLAELDLAEGDLEGGMARLERAIEVTASLSRNHPEVAAELATLAVAEFQAGQPDAAIQHALEADRIMRSHFRLVAGAVPERLALRYARVRPPALDTSMQALQESGPTYVADVWDEWIDSRALVLEEMADRRRAATELDTVELAELRQELIDASRRLAQNMVSLDGSPDEQQKLEAARSRVESAERELAEASSAFRRSRAQAQHSFEDIARALPVGSALVAFARYQPPQMSEIVFVDEDVGVHRRGPASYAAFVLTGPSANPAIVWLGSAEPIDRLASRWWNESSRGLGGDRSEAEAEAACRDVGSLLREVAWDPIEPMLRGATRVFVVPDGSLQLVNLMALPTKHGGYIVEDGPTIHILSTERDVLPASNSSAAEGLFVLGGAVFDRRGDADRPVQLASRGAEESCGGLATIQFAPLPATQREAEAVAALWQQQSEDHPVVLTGIDASETGVKSRAGGHRVVHLATHGFFVGEDCASPGASTRGIGGLEPSEVSGVASTNVNPLRISGLALSGANLRGTAGPEEEDGILTAEEIASLDWSGMEWAVLSACDSGRGAIVSGEGIFGLRRSIQIAGARTVIGSLWAVEDEATLALVELLYRNRLVAGYDTAGSMREAQRAVLVGRRERGESTHPFYWGGFVAVGDWR